MIKTILKNLTPFDKVVLIVITLVMANNVEHLAFVHYSIARHSLGTHLLNTLHSVLVVLIVELSIIVMVFKGQHVYAGMYTLFLFILSLIYYPLDTFWNNRQYGFFIASIIYSLMFTLSIWYFSRMAAKRQEENSELERIKAKECELIRNVHELTRINNELKSKQTETKGNNNETTMIAESFLRNHILYESWLSKKRNESSRNGYDSVMNEMSSRIKNGETITLKEYLTRIKTVKHEAAV